MTNFFFFLLQCVYLILPGMFANMAPSIFRKVNFLAVPMDFNKKWKGKPITGNHKTWRGLFFGLIASVLIAWLQTYLYKFPYFKALSFIDYTQFNFIILGILVGLGVILGDAGESIIKRRLNIPPGGRFFPWDQIDSLIGGLLFISILYVPPLKVIITLFALAIILHVSVKRIGYWLKIDDKKW